MEEIQCSFSVIHHDKQVVKKKLTIHTFPHSEVCHLAQLPKLQLRTLGTDGAAFRQAASLTLIVNVAEISCLQVKSRVWIPSPHVALHEDHSPSTHLPRREKNTVTVVIIKYHRNRRRKRRKREAGPYKDQSLTTRTSSVVNWR